MTDHGERTQDFNSQILRAVAQGKCWSIRKECDNDHASADVLGDLPVVENGVVHGDTFS